MNKNFYYEIERDARKNILAGLGTVEKGTYTAPHFHRCVEIIYFVNGSAKVNIDNETFDIKQDEILYCKRCSVHEITYDYSTSILLIIPPKYSNDFEHIFQEKSTPALLSDVEFNKTLKDFFIHLSNQTETSDMVIKGYVNIILGKLFEHYPNKKIENPSNIDLIINVLNYVDKHYTENITLDSISKRFGYNKYYFSRLFNNIIGENLTSYINGVRLRNLITKARTLNKPNFSELILDYGFESFSTFYRTCYQKYNVAPKELLQLKNL